MADREPPRMPLFRGGRPLKRWRYVAAFSPTIMVSVAHVRVGPLPVRFFAAAEPDRPIVTAAPLAPGAIRLDPGRARVRTRAAEIDVTLEEDEGVATWHDERRIWTRKQAGVPGRVVASIGGRRYDVDCRGVIDDTAGFHRRHTRWWWSAGVGTAVDGRGVAWNLVSGVNDEPTGSERAIWVDGVPHEGAPVRFAPDLTSIDFAAGGALRFSAWGERSARTNLLLLRSRYRQPFGTFSGELPGVGALREGYGVMEWHDAYW